MKLSAKTGVALAITALSLVVTVGSGTAGPSNPGTAVSPQPDPLTEKGPLPYYSHGIGVDQSQFSGTVDELDPAIRTAIAARESDRNVQRALTEKGPIPYFSNGIGVDQSLWGGQVSLGLTGDSPITRVVGQEPSGLTGDSPRTRGQVFQAKDTFASNGNVDVNWTWVGFGAGMAALLAAVMGVLYLSRHRDRVALP